MIEGSVPQKSSVDRNYQFTLTPLIMKRRSTDRVGKLCRSPTLYGTVTQNQSQEFQYKG